MDGPHPWPLPRCGRGGDNVDYQYSGRVARQDGQRQEGELMGMQPVIIVKFLLAVVGLAVFGRYYNLYVAAHEAEPASGTYLNAKGDNPDCLAGVRLSPLRLPWGAVRFALSACATYVVTRVTPFVKPCATVYDIACHSLQSLAIPCK